jgi:ankyrin repeat protein
MTGSDFEELQRFIAQVQIESPTHEALPPAYDAAVSPGEPSPSYPVDHKQPIPYNEEEEGQSSSSSPSSSRPKRGKVGVFFRSISSKFAAPVEPLVTPLCRAAEAGDTHNLTGLLRQGANPNGLNDEGYTPLTSVIHSSSNPDVPATVRLLLDGGADPSARDGVWSLPALWHASRAGRADVASLLLDAGADPRARNTYGAPYFADAAEKDPPALLELLLRRGADPDTANLTGRKVIVPAVEHNDVKRTRILLDAGATVTATNTTGHSILSIAITNRNLEMVTYLISRGAEPTGRNGFGEALVSLAIAPDAIDIARLLLARGADPNSKSLTGQPCLVTALQQDLPDFTALLLKHGADANAKDITGRPALSMAISQKRYAHATLLLEHGADPTVPGNRSGSAHLITTHLKNKSPDQASFLRLMLRQGAKPDVMPSSWDGHGGATNTPLGYCVSESLPELVAILVVAGADPHRAGQSGTVPFSDPLGKNTPFRLAAAQGRAECLRAMLEGGAVSRLRGKTGVDPDEVLLQAAAAAGENREIVDMLLDEGVERPAWAVAFAEREGSEALRDALGKRASKLGVDGGWFEARQRSTIVGGEAAPPPYEGGL